MADFERRSRTRKLPSSFTVVVMPLVLSVLMSGIVSAVATGEHRAWSHLHHQMARCVGNVLGGCVSQPADDPSGGTPYRIGSCRNAAMRQ